MAKQNTKYTIFISYRRDGGSEMAKHLRDSLTARGYSVFLDVESLRNGPFNTALYDVINAATDFLLILPPNGLDRCVDDNDWVRLEIEHALASRKNIIPIRLKGFEFPAELPESIDCIRMLNGPTATDVEYYDAYVKRLEGFLQSKPRSKWKSRLIVALAAILVLATGLGIYYCMSTYPITRRQQGLVSSMITYSTLNLSQADKAGSSYLKALDRAGQYIEGKTTDSRAALLYELTYHRDAIDKSKESLAALPVALRQDLMNSPFNVGDLEAMKTALTQLLTEYSDNITFIKDNILSNDTLRTEHKVSYINLLKAWADLDAEILFYNFNESLLPITRDSALQSLKNSLLPGFGFIYSKRIDLTHDAAALLGKEEAIYQQYNQSLDDYLASMDRETSNFDPQFYQEELEQLKALSANRGLDTTELQARLERLIAKSQKVESLQSQYSELSDQVKKKRADLYQKYKPSEDDEAWLLWGKGTKFMSAGMPSAAAECFLLCSQKDDPDYRIASPSAHRFAEVCTELGLEGGVVVCLFEVGLPHQAVELGDVIYAVDGKPVNTFSEYDSAVQEGVYTVSLLRFDADGYEQLDSTIDTSLGRLGLLELTNDPASAG